MLFSSISFLFFFLPCLLLCYFLSPKKLKNYVLLLFSLFFYYFGEKNYLILLIIVCLINYLFGLVIEKTEGKTWFILGITINIGILFYYKYTNFFLDTTFALINQKPPFLKIVLPLGISFFTFQNISYLCDVYKGKVTSQKNFFTYAMYITLFPQLIAGPIVRYQDVNEELKDRKETIKDFSEGITRFVLGLAKKVLLADGMYFFSTKLLESNMSFISYWLVAIAFSLQIYYDFSGYSDMAIGLGRMFGFHFKENFNYPFVATSITDFWRRWHISLSSFFKDYVYIPLGGNRSTKIKNIRNLFIVWLLTGFWHGASWNFFLWGMYFFILLIIEKAFLKKYLKGGLCSHFYTLFLVCISFVIFSFTDITELLELIKGMFTLNNGFINNDTLYYLKNYGILLLFCIIGCIPFIKNFVVKLQKGERNKWFSGIAICYILCVFLISIARIISSTFQPFIYFRF